MFKSTPPLVICKFTEAGTKYWFLPNGRFHREDGPAIIYRNGTKSWWFNGKPYKHEEWFNLLTPEQQFNYLWNLNEE